MKNILIAGGSGFIGRFLIKRLNQEGFTVSILSRKEKNIPEVSNYSWNPLKGIIDKESLKNQHVIINLSGAGIADKLWTKKRKETIIRSRVESTSLLIETLEELNSKPELFINASAIGYYGHRPNEILTEQSERGTGFLSDVCFAWENALKPLVKLDIAMAIIRVGIVLGNTGGSLPKLLLPLKFGMNLIFGKGTQPISWIHIDDVLNIICHLINGELWPGIYNGAAPNPVDQITFNKILAQYSGKRTIKLRIPAWLMLFMMGELATVFLNHQQINPLQLTKQKFSFQYPQLSDALDNLMMK